MYPLLVVPSHSRNVSSASVQVPLTSFRVNVDSDSLMQTESMPEMFCTRSVFVPICPVCAVHVCPSPTAPKAYCPCSRACCEGPADCAIYRTNSARRNKKGRGDGGGMPSCLGVPTSGGALGRHAYSVGCDWG